MTKFPILDLPEELVSLIASHLTQPSDLLHLVLASKQFSRIAIEHLYRELRLIARKNSHVANYQRLKAIVVQLLACPDLAACVEDLVIRWDWATHQRQRTNSTEVRSSTFLDEEDAVVEEGMKRVSTVIGGGKEAVRSIWENEEGLMTLLIFSLPSLKSLDYEASDYMGIHFVRMMSKIRERENDEQGKGRGKREKTTLPALNKLTEILLVSHKSPQLMIPEAYLPIFRLVGLRRVSILGMHRPYSREEFFRRDTIFSNSKIIRQMDMMRTSTSEPFSSVQYLEIRESTLSFPMLCNLISICRELHTFIYEHRSSPYILFPSILEALNWHAGSLRNLSLNYLAGKYIEYVEDCHQGLDFSQLPRLVHLRTTVAGLVGTEAPPNTNIVTRTSHANPQLPENLKILSLIDDGVDELERMHFITALLQLLTAKQSVCPGLKKISTLASDQDAADTLEMQLRTVTEGQDVEVVVLRSSGQFVERGWGMEESLHWYGTREMRNMTLKTYQNGTFVPTPLDLLC